MGAVLPRPPTPSSITLLLPVLVTGSFIPVRLLMLELKCEGKVEHCLLPGGDIRMCAVVTMWSQSGHSVYMVPSDRSVGYWGRTVSKNTTHPSGLLSLQPAPVRTKVGTGG